MVDKLFYIFVYIVCIFFNKIFIENFYTFLFVYILVCLPVPSAVHYEANSDEGGYTEAKGDQHKLIHLRLFHT